MKERPKIIYFVTPYHSGTWYLLHQLLKYTSINGFMQVQRFPDLFSLCKKGDPSKKKLLANRHQQMSDEERFILQERLGSPMIIHNHITAPAPQMALILAFPSVITFRDPIAGLLTRHRRYPKLFPHEEYIELWRKTFNLIRHFENTPYELILYPVDLETTNSIHDLLESLEITADKLWEPGEKINTSGNYTNKILYNSGDLEQINKVKGGLGKAWNELVKLCNEEWEILERIGYSDLPWRRLV